MKENRLHNCRLLACWRHLLHPTLRSVLPVARRVYERCGEHDADPGVLMSKSQIYVSLGIATCFLMLWDMADYFFGRTTYPFRDSETLRGMLPLALSILVILLVQDKKRDTR